MLTLLQFTLTSILLGTVFFSYLFELYLGVKEYSTPEEILFHIAPVGWVLVGLSMIEFLATFGVRFYATKFSEVEVVSSKTDYASLLNEQYSSHKRKPNYLVFDMGDGYFLGDVSKPCCSYSCACQS